MSKQSPQTERGPVLVKSLVPPDAYRVLQHTAIEAETTHGELAGELIAEALRARFPDEFPATAETPAEGQ